MKLLLVLGSDDSFGAISKSVRPLGFELVRYRHVLKAMDNVDEINPTAIIVSARDFPRHWKVLVHFIRCERPKESCPIIILKGVNFDNEETCKAFFLGVNGLVDETLDNPVEVDRLQNILSRYIPVHEKRKHLRFYVEAWHRIAFLFAVPGSNIIVTGDIKTISTGGLSFFPANASLVKDIEPNTELTECSLRIGDAILSPVCRLVCTGRTISMKFVSLTNKEKRILEQYLDDLPLSKVIMNKGA
jgi:hypothetical protein